MTALALSFQNTKFDVIDRNQQPWLRSGQIASALGYADQSSINRIFARNQDEFTDAMTGSVKLTDPNGDLQETRIFSLRGCHLLAMFARTPVAKEFRKWVLDILDKEFYQPPYGLKQLPEPKTKKALPGGLTIEQQDCIKALVKDRAATLPKERQARAIIMQWSAIKKKFGCTYKEVSPDNFANIVSLLGRLPLEGELLEREESSIALTLTLAPLQDKKTRRWLVTQAYDEGAFLIPLADEEVMSREDFINRLKREGYLVVKKDELSVGAMVLDHIPAKLLPVMIETAWSRLRAINRGLAERG